MTELSARVDLHAHSTASDGELTPAALVQYARERGLAALALTDHDSVDGLDAAIAAARGNALELVPGVEITADVSRTELHVLGYFVNFCDVHFLSVLEKFRDMRYGRAEKIVKKLANLGIAIPFERVREIAGDASIGRPHIAQVLVETEYVKTVPEAFDKYIGATGPAYVERFRLTPQDAVTLILRAGGVPVLAHPRRVVRYVRPLMKVGLLGLESDYGAYDQQTRSNLRQVAKENGLIATGGSDFHGLNFMAYKGDLGSVPVLPEVIESLREAANQVKKQF